MTGWATRLDVTQKYKKQIPKHIKKYQNAHISENLKAKPLCLEAVCGAELSQHQGGEASRMGNSCGVDSTSVQFDELDTLRKRSQPSEFPCNIKAWRLYSDANRRWYS